MGLLLSMFSCVVWWKFARYSPSTNFPDSNVHICIAQSLRQACDYWQNQPGKISFLYCPLCADTTMQCKLTHSPNLLQMARYSLFDSSQYMQEIPTQLIWKRHIYSKTSVGWFGLLVPWWFIVTALLQSLCQQCSFTFLPHQLSMVGYSPAIATKGDWESIKVQFQRGSLKNGYHIQGRQQQCKLPNPDSGR